MVFFSMVTIKVVCQVGSLLDTYDSQCTQIYHSFTVYLKGAKDSKSKHIYGRDNQKSNGKGSKIAKNVMVWAKLRFKGRVLARKAFLSLSMRN